MNDSALVLFSGGQDSTTCLAWALHRFHKVETIGFDYGQRHIVELEARPKILSALRQSFPHWDERLGEDHVLPLELLRQIGGTALTSDMQIEMTGSGLPNTFVPGRNIFFLTAAAALGYRRGITHLVGGMCETDFSGYPDCRDATIKSTAQTLSLALEKEIVIHTPLMKIDKAATWKMAFDAGGQTLVDLIVEDSVTCYHGDREHRHAWGYGCGTCPACDLRAKGWVKHRAS
ncbi:MAG TPA: 7-cyano-7-deazaguanine synthase QueC [Rhizomicrobium sp.]|jgi:7-cyano-7-deazaguanine synthase|nr:7-cyano-7-deazaguanine synthase QueC [Rhizomicrobium sp.]